MQGLGGLGWPDEAIEPQVAGCRPGVRGGSCCGPGVRQLRRLVDTVDAHADRDRDGHRIADGHSPDPVAGPNDRDGHANGDSNCLPHAHTHPNGAGRDTVVRSPARDTMFSLANRFGTTVAALAALNGISDPSVLRAGSFILVPGGSATTTPTATATVTATRTQPPAGPSRLVRNGSRSSNAIALTFDMGGRVDPALDIMNWLIANNVKATIFPTGSMVQNRNTDAGRQVLALVAANPGLFELGNHSYSHPDFTTITEAQIREELARTEAAVAAYTTLSMQPRFRPPFGAYDARVLSAVGAAGYAQTLMWDVDTIDWRPEADGGPTAASMAAKVVNNAQGGTIVLMHLGGYNTLGALPAMVQGLRDRGFQFVRISELPLD